MCAFLARKTKQKHCTHPFVAYGHAAQTRDGQSSAHPHESRWSREGSQRTIRYRQPPILFLDFEFIGEAAGLWVLRIIHLCFLVW